MTILKLLDLIRISSQLIEEEKNRQSPRLNPWLVSQVIPPLESLGGNFRKRNFKKIAHKNREKREDNVMRGLRRYLGMRDREKGGKEGSIQRDLWKKISEVLRLSREFLDYVNTLAMSLENLYGKSRLIDETYVTDSRFMVGTGRSTGWEAGLAPLLPFGVPWVPGSTLKGALRYRLVLDIVEELDRWNLNSQEIGQSVKSEVIQQVLSFLGLLEPAKGRKLEDLDLKDLEEILSTPQLSLLKEDIKGKIKLLAFLFGTKKLKGSLICVGGFPISKGPIMEVDMVNSHYSAYYRSPPDNPTPPGDWSDSSPFFYPVVRKGVKFRFLLVMDEGSGHELGEMRRTVVGILARTLMLEGLGAKTGVGYGLFTTFSKGVD